MIKVYRCVSEISFNLKIGGNKRRINFDPVCGGKSQYRTNEKEVQEGIEKLEQFGRIISIEEIIKEEEGDEAVVLDSESGGESGGGVDDNGGETGSGLENGNTGIVGGAEKDIQSEITSFAEAKEYLITKGCEKTIRSRDHIVAYAKELGIEFPNLK